MTILPEMTALQIGHCKAPAFAARRDAGLRPIRFPAGAALIRRTALGSLLFDTGYGAAFFTATQSLPERFYRWTTPTRLLPAESLERQLSRLQAWPDLVLLSHLHADHVCGLFDLARLPPVLTSREAWNALQQGGRLATLKAGCPELVRRRLLSLKPRFIEDYPTIPSPLSDWLSGPCYDLAGDGSLLALPLPGHGAGQFGLLLPQTTTGPQFLISDAAWSRAALRDQVPPPDAIIRRLGVPGDYSRTFRSLCALSRGRPDIGLWPSHCPEAFS
ncbi:MBL fold metallo-hydrolase [Pseudogemmobacter faecipullorum]|uniref:MBL fold metallo-hydrolase n=1 Tax=Pseudogemmobacter faecipullorum TaxID=2755041 RepID=UPI001D00BEEE